MNWIFTIFFRIIGSLLGVATMVITTFLRVVNGVVDLVVVSPVRWVKRVRRGGLGSVGRYAVVAICLYISWVVLRNISLSASNIFGPSSSSSPSPHTPIYHPPDSPPADISELSDRLQRIESALAALSISSEKSITYIEDDAKKHQAEFIGRLGYLEGQIQKESSKTLEVEAKIGEKTKQGIDVVKHEIQVLKAQVQAQGQQVKDAASAAASVAAVVSSSSSSSSRGSNSNTNTGPSVDEEARSKLRAIEERVGNMEGGVKEAIELSKNSLAAIGTGGAAAGLAATWWNRLGSPSASKNGLTIKSTDGQDVTTLITHIVQKTISYTSSMDNTISKPDYALYSGGASVIPSLTSQTLRVVPNTFIGKFFDIGTVDGRPPVTALHHELHIGYCWPFVGEKGQLGIMLAGPVVVEEVTIDHVPREVAMDLRSAPRQMEVWGLVEGRENLGKYREFMERKKAMRDEERIYVEDGDGTQGSQQQQQQQDEDDDEKYPGSLPRNPLAPYMKIAEFVYNVHSPHYIQTFPILEEVRELGMDFGVVVLRVESNWGKEEMTCLYRVRVHGQPLGGVPETLGEEYAVLPSSSSE